jgi:hypothetical protein
MMGVYKYLFDNQVINGDGLCKIMHYVIKKRTGPLFFTWKEKFILI